jgi:phospholipid/cholesterol/gamma-HCH transport system permease protein
LVSTLIAMPLLTTEAIAFGIGAGYVLGTNYLGIQPAYAWHNMVKYTQPEDVLTGLIKSIIFGGVIAIISCYKGLNCGEGAEGVGRATTEAVVYCCITILVSNFFLTLFLNKVLAG